jgi:hypothetical protein
MLKELKSAHKNVLQLSFNGFKDTEIAEKLGLHVVTIHNIKNSPLGKSYLDGLNDKMKEASLDVRKELISMNRSALDTFKRLLISSNKVPASVQYNVAKDIMDRNGYKAPDKIIMDMNFKTKTDAEIDAEIEALEGSIHKTTAGSAPMQVSTEAECDINSPSNNISSLEILPEAEKLSQDELALNDLDIDDLEDPLNLEDPLEFNDLTNSENVSDVLGDSDFNPFKNI